MSANLMGNEGFFNGATWHNQGQYREGNFTCTEALPLSGCDTQIELWPLFAGQDGFSIPAKGGRAIVQFPHGDSLSYDVLGLATEHYQVLQNRQVCEIFDPISSAWPVSSMFALGKGEVYCIVFGKQSTEVNGDVINLHFTVVENHTGKDGTYVMFTPIRAVCQNTLIVAKKQGRMFVRVRHSQGNVSRLENVSSTIAEIQHRNNEIMKLFGQMGKIPFNLDEFLQMLDMLFPMPKEKEKQHTNLRQRAALLEAFGRFNDVFPQYGNTGWAAYNAVTEVSTHYKPARGPQNTLYSTLFGSRAELSAEAFSYVLEKYAL